MPRGGDQSGGAPASRQAVFRRFACSKRVAVRAIVFNEPLKILSVRLATSPTTSLRLAWSLTICRPLTANFSGSLPFTSMPKTLTLSGIIAVSRRLILRTAGAPLRSRFLTDLRADFIGWLAISAADSAAPTATSSNVVAVSLIRKPPVNAATS
jgi:hypothetical protein